jgi:hypothetical protein
LGTLLPRALSLDNEINAAPERGGQYLPSSSNAAFERAAGLCDVVSAGRKII